MAKRTISKEVMDSIKKYAKRIKEYYNVDKIILFGSYAKGVETEDSDIDVAVISNDFKNSVQDGANLIGLTWNINTKIEPHAITKEDYDNVATPFVQEIVNTGIKVA